MYDVGSELGSAAAPSEVDTVFSALSSLSSSFSIFSSRKMAVDEEVEQLDFVILF